MAKNNVIIFHNRTEFKYFRKIWFNSSEKERTIKGKILSLSSLDGVIDSLSGYNSDKYPVVIIAVSNNMRFLHGELNDLKEHDTYCKSFGGIYQPYNINFVCGRINASYKSKKLIP